ncbi:MAG: pantoate--beta-alanine ligase [Opitutaceae bacterium]|nr:pantoate--beta-alanine ligase [Opitutaceae bacterium]
MNKIETVAVMRALSAEWRAQGKTIALVPTMGALHAGQAALIRAAVQQADVVVVSIFVNPHQFSPNEIMANYPRSLEEDLQLCAACGAHFVFAPAMEEIFPRGYSTYVSEDFTAKPLEGVSRPAHFRGVTTMMVKLFNLVHPTRAFFGQKTAQRAAVVRKMAADLGFPVEIVVVPTARDADGLATGVRNREFTATQRQEALALSKALTKARGMSDSGVRSPDRIIAEVTHILGEHRRIRIIYVSIVDRVTMEPTREVWPGKSLLTIAVWVDEVRLIDNVLL